MKIAVASVGDPSSITTWSTIPYHIIHYLEKSGHQVIRINLKEVDEPWYYSWFRRIYHRTQKRWFLSMVEPYVLKKIAQQFDADVNESNPDLVLAIHGDILAYTKFEQPSIIIHDTTFASLLDYYSDFSGLTKRSVKNGNIMYQLALDRCSMAVFSSTWASNSAIQFYQSNQNKIITIPFGANLILAPEKYKVAEFISQRMNNECINFLFLGKDWKRKGWEDALKFVKILNQTGVKSKIIAVGCKPPIHEFDAPYVQLKGFLNKGIPEENALLEKIFEECHALLLPSLAECFGCVYCEANAYGLPALGRDTGGIPEIIKEGVNGLLLRPEETIEEFAKRWLSIWEDKGSYLSMCYSSRNEFEHRLNYDVFVKKINIIMSELI